MRVASQKVKSFEISTRAMSIFVACLSHVLRYSIFVSRLDLSHVCRWLSRVFRDLISFSCHSIFFSCPSISRQQVMSFSCLSRSHILLMSSDILFMSFDISATSHVFLRSFNLLAMSFDILCLSRSFSCLSIICSSLSTSHVFLMSFILFSCLSISRQQVMSFSCLSTFFPSRSISHVYRDVSHVCRSFPPVFQHLMSFSCLSRFFASRWTFRQQGRNKSHRRHIFRYRASKDSSSSFHIKSSLYISSHHVLLSYIGWLQLVGSIKL